MTEFGREELDVEASQMLQEVLRRTHLSAAPDLAGVFAEEARAIGVDPLAIYVLDLEQKCLLPVPGPASREALPVQGTMAGRVFASSSIVDSEGDGGGRRVWLPLIDGTERLGVMEMTFARRS